MRLQVDYAMRRDMRMRHEHLIGIVRTRSGFAV